MKRLLIILFIAMLINSYNAYSQYSFNVDKLKEYVELLRENSDDDDAIEVLYSELSYLSENPLDLNNLTRDRLKIFPFLSDKQIESLVVYKERFGRMLSIYELKGIKEMDIQTIELLLPFVYICDISVDKRHVTVDNMLKYGRNELLFRYDQCFQQKKGYKSLPDSILSAYPNRKYLGESFYNSLRYSYSFDDKIQLGFTAEKDAGESFMNNHKGYDFYSAHLLIKDIGRFRTIALGDYKMSFGQGLVVSTDFTPSRGIGISQIYRRNNGFRRHYSVNETDYFRGLATTLSVNDDVGVSLFYSYKYMDGTVTGDTIRSLKTDGLHRLQRDMDKRNQLSMQVYGGNVRYSTSDLAVGITALNYSFMGKTLHADPLPYNLYHFRGESNTNIGVDYMLRAGDIKLYGETAMSQNKAIATLNAVQFEPTSYASLLLLYRNYSKQYHSYYGNAFSQNSSVQNEQGVYLGLQLTPIPYWKLFTYIDVFRFPWLKYGIDSPSSGLEYMTQVDYNKGKSFSFYMRYRYKQAERNEVVSGYQKVLPYNQHRSRIQFIYGNDIISFRSSLDGIIYNKENGESSCGYMLAQSSAYKPTFFPIELDMYAAYFNTDDSYSEIYSYEKTLLHIFNRPSFYGEGIRLALSLRLKPIRKLTVSLKTALTHYFDRETIGTALEEIEGKIKSDMNLIVAYKF
jgi:hypothetical protein